VRYIPTFGKRERNPKPVHRKRKKKKFPLKDKGFSLSPVCEVEMRRAFQNGRKSVTRLLRRKRNLEDLLGGRARSRSGHTPAQKEESRPWERVEAESYRKEMRQGRLEEEAKRERVPFWSTLIKKIRYAERGRGGVDEELFTFGVTKEMSSSGEENSKGRRGKETSS